MNIDNFFQSKMFKWLVLSVCALIPLAFVFCFGVFIGARKADFSFKWAEAYHRNFGGPREGFLNNAMMGNDFIEANGIFGQIIKINGQNITIEGNSGVEKIILVEQDTTIVSQKKNLQLQDLKNGDKVIVIGEPNNDGQIEAALIRIIPPPPAVNYQGCSQPKI